MKNMLRWTASLAALALLALVMLYMAGFFDTAIAPGWQAPDAALPGTDGERATVEARREPVLEPAAGTVRARDETLVSARITATIATLTPRAGDRVAAGEVLATLDARAAQAQLTQQREALAAAEARLAEAEPAYRRILSLADRGLASQADRDRAQSELRAAEAELGRARGALQEVETLISYSTLRAPRDGRVLDRYADPGDTATPGMPLLRLYDPRSLRLEASVRESLAAGLRPGDALGVRIDALGRRFQAGVEEIVPAADPGARAFLVRAALPPQDGLYPGMFGRLLIPAGERERYTIPAAAVARIGQLELVTVVTDSGAERRFVRTAAPDGAPDGTGEDAGDDRVEVLSGLAPGEQVLLP